MLFEAGWVSVSYRGTDQPLSWLLRQIGNQTDLRFDFPKSQGSRRVSCDIKAVFAFMSLLETNEPMHSTWVQAATNCLMAVFEPASLGHPQPDAEGKYPPFRHPGFASNDRNFAAESFALAVDWLYPHLTADQKAKIRKCFLLGRATATAISASRRKTQATW